MDNRIPPFRPDAVVSAQSTPRPTPRPARVDFSQVLARGANGIVAGAEAALNVLPGGPMVAVAIRGAGGAGGTSSPMSLQTGAGGGGAGGVTAEGPGGGSGAATGGTAGGAPTDGGIQSTMQQSQEMNLYYLQIQEQMNAQNRTYSALTNVLKAEHDTVKTAIGNIH